MKLLVTVTFCLIFKIALSATFYISPAGSDQTGNGSSSNPWKSLYKATSAVIEPGSVIHVMAGEYTETQQSLLAVGVSIEGEGVNSVLKSSLTADWTEMLSLRSAAEGTNGNQHISYLKFDGQNLSTYWCIQIIGRSNVEIHHITMVDFKASGIFFDGRTDNKLLAPVLYATGNSFHDNIVHNCAGYNLSTGEFGRGALNIGGQKDMLVYNNTITQTERPDGYNGWPIKYSLNGHNKGLKIYNNIITKIPFAGSFGGDHGWDFSIELWHCEGGLEIYGNTIQGAIDLVHVAKNGLSFGAWIHNNKISQPSLNAHYETGILFEKGVESALVENNIVDKCSSGVEVFCEYYPNYELGEHDSPYNPVIDFIIRNNRFTNINLNKGVGIHIASGPKIIADMHDVYIYNNTITGSDTGKPYWGISIQEILSAKNIQIHHNKIENFTAASIYIDPAELIDSLLIENNFLSGNGYGNKPSFITGKPSNYSFNKNKSNNGTIFSYASFKMNIIRPFYHSLKHISILELLSVFSAIFCLMFFRKENIYAFPMGLIFAVSNIFLLFENDKIEEFFIPFLLLIMSIYGWILWAKRDKRKHRILRITSSTNKNNIFSVLLFTSSFVIFWVYKIIFKFESSFETIHVLDTLISATAVTAIWSTSNKKVESWYWWILCLFLKLFTYFETNFLLKCFYYSIFLLLSVWVLYKWKKKRTYRYRKVI